jgi:hypothetical protein
MTNLGTRIARTFRTLCFNGRRRRAVMEERAVIFA